MNSDKIWNARVSTRKQEIGGNSLESQFERLQSEGCEIIIQEAFTGTKTDRSKFSQLLNKLKQDDLVITKLDRFACSTLEGIKTVENLFKKGVKVHVLNMGLVEETPIDRLIFNVMSAFTEFEKDMIVERT